MARHWILLCILTVFIFGELSWASAFKVNDDTGTAEQTHPALACSDNGRAVICWQDTRNGEPQVYFQLLGRNGFPLLNNKPVDPDGSAQYKPRVAMNKWGHFVIVWQDGPDHTAENVFAQRFAANGVPLGEVRTINENITMHYNYSPDIDMNSAGAYVVTWIGAETLAKAWTYCRSFKPDGEEANETSFFAKPTAFPRVSITEIGTFAVAFLRKSDGFWRLNVKKFDHYNSSEPSVNITDVCEYPEEQVNDVEQPDISLCENGDFLVCWRYCEEEIGFPWYIYARYYDNSENELEEIQMVSDFDVSSYSNHAPSIALLEGGYNENIIILPLVGDIKPKHRITWHSDADNTFLPATSVYDIRSRTLTEGVCDPVIMRMHNEREKNQVDPASDFAQSVNVYLTAYTDHHHGHPDIFCNGLFSDAPKRLMSQEKYDDRIVFTWDSPYRNPGISKYKIYRGTEKEGPFSEAANIDLTNRGALGTQMRSWIDTDLENNKDYYYYLKNTQSPLPAFSLSDTVKAFYGINIQQYRKQESNYATITPDLDGVIRAGEWSDAAVDTVDQTHAMTSQNCQMYMKNTDTELYIAIDDPNDPVLDAGNLLLICFDNNNDKKWPNAVGDEGLITILSDHTTTFTPVWGAYPDSLRALSPGEENGVNAIMSDESGHVQYEIVISSEDSHLNIQPGQEIGFTILLDDPSNHYPYHQGYLFAWGLEVIKENPGTFPSVRFAQNPSAVQNKTNDTVPSKMRLSQNYPNPFNPSTDITLQLPESGAVQVTVYNLAGEEINVLLDDHLDSGEHHVQWTGLTSAGQPAPSGVYFYTLKSGQRKMTRKMLLIR